MKINPKVALLSLFLSTTLTGQTSSADAQMTLPQPKLLSSLIENVAVKKIVSVAVLETPQYISAPSASIPFGTDPRHIEINLQIAGYCWGDFVLHRRRNPDEFRFDQVSEMAGGPSAACEYEFKVGWLPDFTLFQNGVPQTAVLKIGAHSITALFTYRQGAGFEITNVQY